MIRSTLRARVALLSLSLSVGVAALAPSDALAQRASSSAISPEAEALLQHGVSLRSAGRDADALEQFERAWTLTHSPRARAQIGLAEQALGRWLLAEDHLTEALATRDAWVERNRAALEEARLAVRRRLSTLDVQDAPPGAELFVNGNRVASLPLTAPIRVVAGTVTIDVRAPGFRPVRRDVIVEAGVAARESVSMLRDDTRGTTTGSSVDTSNSSGAGGTIAPSGPSPARIAGIATLAGGGAMLVVGIASHVVRESTAARWNSDACLPASGASRGEACPSERATLDTVGPLSIAGYVTGGVLIATGAVLLGVSASSSARVERPASSARVQWQCAPAVTHLGAACTGAF